MTWRAGDVRPLILNLSCDCEGTFRKDRFLTVAARIKWFKN